MAITTDDFNKIWASTSPLTPYSFSESQYKEGWNFIGSTPPSRQMWDFLQKNNDEKMQYLLNNFDNYLPLNGGTLTGVVNGVTPTAGDNSKKLATTEFVNAKAGNYLPLSGGTMTTGNTLITMGNGESYVRNWPNGLYLGGTYADNASRLILFTNSSKNGFQLHAGDGTTFKQLEGRPNGTLTWAGSNILTAANYDSYALPLSGGTLTGVVNGVTPTADDNSTKIATTEFVNAKADDYLPLSGGTMTGNLTLSGTREIMNATNTDSTFLDGGKYVGGGSNVLLYGKDHSSRPGYFFINARKTDGTSVYIEGRPDGSLSWGGQPIQTSSDKRIKQDFSDVPADVLEAWGKVEWKQFKYKADAERKGEKCRFHTGLVAQDVQKVCGDKILKYGILCHDVQEATEEQEAVDLWTVRYTEALCMEVIYLRNEIKKLREEINALRTE